MQILSATLLALLVTIQGIHSKVYFQENFQDADWESRWINSKHPGKELGAWKWTAGKFYGDAEEDKGEHFGLHGVSIANLIMIILLRYSNVRGCTILCHVHQVRGLSPGQ